MQITVKELLLIDQFSFRAEATSPETVAEYAALMAQGVKFPPVKVAEVGKTKKRILVGGAHRLAAAVKAKLTELDAEIVACKTALDAEILTFTDNVTHGLTLTPQEKRQAIIKLLQKPGFAKLSNAAAAKKLGVSDMSVKRYRDSFGAKSPKANQSGHKNATRTETPKGQKPSAEPKAEGPVRWRIAGAQLGGGANEIASAIVEKVTEGIDPKKSPESWKRNVKVLAEVVESLQAFVDQQSLGE